MTDERRDERVERRIARRVCLLPRAFFSTPSGDEGEGLVYDVSVTGARIEYAAPKFGAPTQLRLTFALQGAISPIQVLAKVVRTTETGFAVRFLDLDKRLRRILEDTLQVIEREAAVDPDRGREED